MIKITYHDEPLFLEVKGHANFKEAGSDIICSAVSGVMLGLNALEESDLMQIKINEGHIKVEATKLNPHDLIVIETIIAQLKSIEVMHPQYVKFIKRRTKQ